MHDSHSVLSHNSVSVPRGVQFCSGTSNSQVRTVCVYTRAHESCQNLVDSNLNKISKIKLRNNDNKMRFGVGHSLTLAPRHVHAERQFQLNFLWSLQGAHQRDNDLIELGPSHNVIRPGG